MFGGKGGLFSKVALPDECLSLTGQGIATTSKIEKGRRKDDRGPS